MNRVKSIGHAVVLLLAAGTFGKAARADGDAGKAVAEALFRDAKQLMESGDVATACPKFAESLTIDRTLGTLLYLAACHEQQGHTATSWSEFSSALTWAQRSGQGERIAFAQKHIDVIEPRLSFIVINAPSIPGLQLKLDQSPLSAAAVGTPLPLDPGSHTIEASAPNRVTWHQTTTVPADPGRVAIDIPTLAPVPAPATPLTTPAPIVSSDGATSPPAGDGGGSGRRAAMWVAVTATGVGVAVGSVFGAMTFSARDSALKACGHNQCTQSGLDNISNARTFATISTIGFGVGLASAAAALYFIVSGNHSESPHAAATALRTLTATPSLSSHEAGLSLQGKF